jgi:hypothetical protein
MRIRDKPVVPLRHQSGCFVAEQRTIQISDPGIKEGSSFLDVRSGELNSQNSIRGHCCCEKIDEISSSLSPNPAPQIAATTRARTRFFNTTPRLPHPLAIPSSQQLRTSNGL